MAPKHLRVGDTIAPITLQSLAHGTVALPRTGLTHLQFRRFAGCPICSLHLRSFAKHHSELEVASVLTVAFFHSSAESLRKYHVDLPFPVIADPKREQYRRFGVEKSWLGMLHPQAMKAGMLGMFKAPSNALDAEGGYNGLPADFLIDENNRVLAVHYGQHADDSWDVSEVIAKARASAT